MSFRIVLQNKTRTSKVSAQSNAQKEQNVKYTQGGFLEILIYLSVGKITQKYTNVHPLDAKTKKSSGCFFAQCDFLAETALVFL